MQVGTDIAMAQITVQPGGRSGWHSHPGGAIIVVKEGSLSVYRSIGSQCQTSTYSAGQAFIERPGEVDQVVNMGAAPYILFVTFPRVPQGESARTDVPDPGTCPGL
jgi:quercetin dioxygenase-like cupin family protein